MSAFDDLLRGKLDGLGADRAPDWERLRDRLDAADGASFDELVGERASAAALADGAGAVPDWDALSARLPAAPVDAGAAFDDLLARKLTPGSVSAAPQTSWQRLSHRMDTFWSVRRRLVQYRALEVAAAAAIALLLIPLLRLPGERSAEAHSAPVAERVASPHLATPRTPARSPFYTADELAVVYAEPAASDALPARPAERPTSTTPGAYGLTTRTPLATVLPRTSESVAGAWTNRAAVEGSPDAPAAPTYPALTYWTGLLGTPGVASALPPASRLASPGHPVTAADAAAPSRTRQPQPIDFLLPEAVPPPPNALAPVAIALAGSGKWRVAAAGGVRLWDVATPPDYDFGNLAARQRPHAVTAGAQVSRSLGRRLELASGLAYTRLDYDPDVAPVFAQDDDTAFGADREGKEAGVRSVVRERFDGVSLGVVQVPLDLRVNLAPPASRLRVWAKAGVAADLVLAADYAVEADRGLRAKPVESSVAPASLAYQSDRPLANESAKAFSDTKRFEPGLAEGGTVAGNAFLSARVGAELEYALNRRTGVFASLDRNQYLPVGKGIGPTEDELSSTALTMGIRVSL